MDELRCDVTERIATVTLDRPTRRNALSTTLISALAETMADVNARSDVDVIVVTGADPAFCAGLDLNELGSTGSNLAVGSATTSPWDPVAKPVIGAINGVAVTGGLEIALHCDFLLASERASFGDTHTRVGILPGWGLSVLLPRRIGLARAIEMSLSGNFIDADEAFRLGLVNHVVPHDELLSTVTSLAKDIILNDREAVRALLSSYRRIEEASGVGVGVDLEAAAAEEWRQRVTPEGVEQRRQGIMERGREQT
jgi:enoyl-CoA hydratase